MNTMSTTAAYNETYFIVEKMETELIEWSVTGGTTGKCKQIFFFREDAHLFRKSV